MPDKTTVVLPELPEPTDVIVVGTQAVRAFTADQMRAYATAALAQKDGEIAALKVAARRYLACMDQVIEALEIDLDTTEINARADGVTIVSINLGEVTRELRAALGSQA